MFRRIELIGEIPDASFLATLEHLRQRPDITDEELREWAAARYQKSGLLGSIDDALLSAWVGMPNPRRAINRNCRFFFTELGWRRYGRPSIAVCQRIGQRYRVLSVKERAVEIVYRDEVQVAVRPRKPRSPAG